MRVLMILAVNAGFTFELASHSAEVIEAAAIVIILVGTAASIGIGLVRWVGEGFEPAFDLFKRYMARGLLIGLDLLIAADVIKTVTLAPTLENAIVLALLVLIRTFLSWTLVLEVERRWPWQDQSNAS